ncbi:formate dehydrogenase accessory protein FdhE [Desulfolutivibrio sulfoxidireducens]|uniref:formate dehydrogenase accessory protein FdhE n=1 Tax=Desulfolutivibrio sulfoxidireducens TaxID=2773299 RepID=UPI00159E959E|nr:formate dehydrogenase accessory protein FdhE [Desulfolutivibrio sulfoxidireducens]QLA16342.1 formate dehydrogenase accessory protein FdhE [Desulfolutivibrio sulfoxidireducens]QLA19767.1 formate dehydrogenase accessory protein FdhE [Desulfolutivibrio sulfoxidireducens]
MNPDMEKEKTLFSKKLDSLGKKDCLPGPLLALVAATIDLQLAAKDRLLEAASPGDTIAASLEDVEKVLRGACLLPRERFTLDRETAMGLLESLSALAADSWPPLAHAAARIAAARQNREFDPAAAMDAHLAGDDAFFRDLERLTPQAPRFPGFLVQAAMAPGLEILGAQVYARFPADRSWTHGHCPVCGSPPLVSRLLGKEGARHLTCSFCHVEYRARRLMCPFCGEDDAGKLDYFTTPDEPGYRIDTCATCMRYIKTTDFREFDRPSHPLLDDLESLALDLAVQKKGFTRPVLSAWGF